MPLVRPQTGLILPPTNRLAYPAGRAPGFDPSHPAANKSFLTVIAGPGENYINLLTGAPLTNQKGSQTNVPSANIHGTIGPAVTSLGNGMVLGIAFDARAITSLTTAGILRYSPSTVANYQAVIVFDANVGLFIKDDMPNGYASGPHSSGIVLAFNTPYFVALSTPYNGAGSPLHFVIKNLITGQIFTSSTTQDNSNYAGFISLNVGTDTDGEFANFPIAAAMASGTYIGLPQLLAWADDPWAFWYPRQTQMLVSTQAATQYAAFSIPQRGGRTITQMRGY